MDYYHLPTWPPHVWLQFIHGYLALANLRQKYYWQIHVWNWEFVIRRKNIWESFRAHKIPEPMNSKNAWRSNALDIHYHLLAKQSPAMLTILRWAILSKNDGWDVSHFSVCLVFGQHTVKGGAPDVHNRGGGKRQREEKGNERKQKQHLRSILLSHVKWMHRHINCFALT